MDGVSFPISTEERELKEYGVVVFRYSNAFETNFVIKRISWLSVLKFRAGT
jgi:hypothetical protein